MKKTTDNYILPKRISSVFIYLILTCFILYCGSDGYSGIFESKFRLFCVLCGGYIVLTLLTLLQLVVIGHIKFQPVQILKNLNVQQKLAVLFLIFTWISAFLSPHFPDTLLGLSRYEGAITITVYCLMFLLLSCFGKISKRMIYVFSITVTVFSVICILQIHGMNPFSLYPEGYNFYDAYKAYNGQFLGTIGNTDTVASFLCMEIPALLFSIVRLTDKKRYVLFLPLLLSLYVLFKMWVLAGVVSIILGILLSIPFSLKLTKNTKKLVLLLIAIILTVGIITVYFSKSQNGFIFELSELLHGNFDGEFGSGRIHIWKNVLKEIPQNILFGTGPDTMLKSNLSPFIRYDTQLDASIVAQIDVAHNEYINILFHQGIFAFLSYCTLIVFVVYKWLKQGSNFKHIGILGSSVICYLIQAFFGFSSCAVSPFFWMILAFIINNDNLKESLYG